MIGLVVYLGVLLLVRTVRRFVDRGYAFRFFVRRFAADPTLDARIALEHAGIQVLHYGRSRVGLTAILYALPWTIFGVIAFVIVLVFAAPVWIAALALSATIAIGTSLEHVWFRARGYEPLGGQRPLREWLIVGPAIAARILISTAGFVVAYAGIDSWNRGQGWVGIALMLCSTFPLGVAHFPPKFADRFARRRRPIDFGTTAPTDSALLLRSFRDDRLSLVADVSGSGPGLAQLVLFRTRFEEVIASAMLRTGPLIAIGRPGESLPELGAARTYWPDDGWQKAVESTAFRAERVIVIAGLTRGLAWEVELLRGMGMLQKLLVLVPPDRLARAEARIGRAIDDLGIVGFPYQDQMIPTIVGFGFDADAKPVVYLADGLTWDAYFWALTIHRGLLTGRITAPRGPSARESTAERSVQPPPTPPPTPDEELSAVLGADASALPATAVAPEGSETADSSASEDPVGVPHIAPAPDKAFARYTDRMERLLENAEWEAERLGHRILAGHHLLLALTTHEPTTVERLLGHPAATVRAIVLANVPPGYSLVPEVTNSSAAMSSLLRTLPTIADRLGARSIDVDHLLLALAHVGVQNEWLQRVFRVMEVEFGQVWAANGAGRNLPATEPSMRRTMFDLYTLGARDALVRSNEAARTRGHAHMGTEHVLLGLLEDEKARLALHRLGVTLGRLRSKLEEVLGAGDGSPDHIPFAPSAKEALELAFHESRRLGHDRVGPEHLLLGLLREGEGVAGKVLKGAGLRIAEARVVVAAVGS